MNWPYPEITVETIRRHMKKILLILPILFTPNACFHRDEAVGMGHLGGKDGLLSQLAEKGYELTNVTIKNISTHQVYD